MFTHLLAAVPFLARIRRARTTPLATADTVDSVALDTVNSIADRLDHIHDYLLGKTPELDTNVGAPVHLLAVCTGKPATAQWHRGESDEALAA
jgi:hypothetical protein